MYNDKIQNIMNNVFLELTNKPLAVKKTNNIYSDKLEFSNIERIDNYYIENNKNRLTDIQKQNRILWEKFYSPVGFLNTLIKDEILQVIIMMMKIK